MVGGVRGAMVVVCVRGAPPPCVLYVLLLLPGTVGGTVYLDIHVMELPPIGSEWLYIPLWACDAGCPLHATHW